MIWPLDGSEAGVDLVLIHTLLLLSCKCTQLASEQLILHNKSSEVCIKTRSPPASLPSKGQVTEQTTVKWPISSPPFFPPSHPALFPEPARRAWDAQKAAQYDFSALKVRTTSSDNDNEHTFVMSKLDFPT